MEQQSQTLTPEQIKLVKGLGFLHNRGTRCFNGRIITKNGVLTAEQLRVISEAAARFGAGTVAFTVRLTLEVPGIPFEKIEAFRDFIAPAGLATGGTGAKVRPVVACKGTTCVFGLYDTQETAKLIHERFYEGYREVVLPHKFKIAVGGCPNNCAKPDLNDVGIVGQRLVAYELDKCRGCKKCLLGARCPMHATKVAEGKLVVDEQVCNRCGRCLRQCPFGVAEQAQTRYSLYLGGRWGKKIRIGSRVDGLFEREEMLEMVEKAILLFKSQGNPGERFGETIDRIGLERVRELLLSDRLLEDKQKIRSV